MKEEKYVGLFGLAMSVLQPFLALTGVEIPQFAFILALLGIVGGFFAKGLSEKFLYSAVLFVLIVGILSTQQVLGSLINNILQNMTLFLATYLLIPLLKTIKDNLM